MDQHQLRNLVFEKTGVKVDSNDPIFALVALNEVVLAEAVGRHVALIDAASQEMAMQARAFVKAAGRMGAAPPLASSPAPHAVRRLALAAGIAFVAVLSVVAAQTLWIKAAPAPVMQAPPLAPEQMQALRNGAKLAKVVQGLDQTTRDLIQAEMQKP